MAAIHLSISCTCTSAAAAAPSSSSFPHHRHALLSTSFPSFPILHASASLSLWKQKMTTTKKPTLTHPSRQTHLPSPSLTRVSLQDAVAEAASSIPPAEPAGSTGAAPRKSIWVNPNSPRASRLRQQSFEYRYSRLAQLSGSLDSCDPAEAEVAAALAAVLGERPSERDAVVVLNNMGNAETALLALRWFQERIRVGKDVILYNVTMKVMRKCRNWERVESLWKEMLERGIEPDNITFSTVISCARVCNLPDKAVELFERMQEFGCRVEDVTYSAMIDAYGRLGNVDMAMKLYDQAKAERQLDPVIFSTVIKVCSSSNNFDGALNVYEEMKALGVKPNLITYNTLLDVMGRANQPWQVKTIYREMESNGVLPNRATYAALLRAYGKARYPGDAFRIYREMKEKGMVLTVLLYNTVLAICADLGLVDEAIEIFDEMKSSADGCKPDSWTFSSLITIYSCSGNVSKAEDVLEEMVAAGFEPSIFVLTSLIQCYGKAKQVDSVVGAFGRMLELGITPDDRFCGCLLNVMTLTPKEELEKVIGCISRANPVLGSLVKQLIDEKVADEVFKIEAEEFFKNISAKVKAAYCNCLIDLCVNLNMMERAYVLLDMALRLEIYSALQSKSSTQWSLHVKGLSLGAALIALNVWMNDLSRALENEEDVPLLLGINTGHGKHRYSEKGLAVVFESHLRELNAPFHEAPDRVGWFLTTKVAAKPWLESRSLPKLVTT